MPTLLRHTSGAYVGICRKSLTEVEVDTAAAGYLKISMLLLHHSWNVVHITKALYMTGLEQAAGFHLLRPISYFYTYHEAMAASSNLGVITFVA